jgi:hypothetical protein
MISTPDRRQAIYAEVLETVHRPEYASLLPGVPALADTEQCYIAPESTFYRILRSEGGRPCSRAFLRQFYNVAVEISSFLRQIGHGPVVRRHQLRKHRLFLFCDIGLNWVTLHRFL